jgi:hypothetical protein
MFSTSAKPHPNPHGNPQSIKHSLKLSQKNPTWSCNKIKENLSFHNSLAFFIVQNITILQHLEKNWSHNQKKKNQKKNCQIFQIGSQNRCNFFSYFNSQIWLNWYIWPMIITLATTQN